MFSAWKYLILAASVVLSFSAAANLDDIPHQWTVTANYNLNMQNPDGTNPSSTISFSVSPGLILKDIHEVGLNLTYSVTESENTLTSTTATTSTKIISAFYRYNITISKEDDKIPVILYFGPQVGSTTVEVPTASTTDPSAGAQIGMNLMFSKNLALNVHLFQFDTVFAEDTQLLITQSIGAKYYFE